MIILEGINAVRTALSRRETMPESEIDEKEQTVRQIVNDVRRSGDAAVREYTEKFDGVKLDSLEVDKSQIDRAFRDVDKDLLAALKLAAERIKDFHTGQKQSLLSDSVDKKLGWLVRPLDKIGVCAPGFQAPLPSTVLMTALPARVAGVNEIVLVTPPNKQGRVAPALLAAAAIAGVDRVFSIGGAQAVAALAYGTESVPGVDKVCGPGNIWVTLAKKTVSGDVGIDGLYGPSEVIIIADKTVNPAYIAADLLAQAEHGSGASAIMITNNRGMAEKVAYEIEKQMPGLSRRGIIAGALENNGFIAVVKNIDSAIELANGYAPEHLCLAVADAAAYVAQVKNAGCLFVGENSIEAIVDYTAGPSHVLPTGGTARFGSGLGILDFVKLVSMVNLDAEDIRQLGAATSIIARAEGLDAHARAVDKRLENMGRGDI
jgi:histidinol dehydrogenase